MGPYGKFSVPPLITSISRWVCNKAFVRTWIIFLSLMKFEINGNYFLISLLFKWCSELFIFWNFNFFRLNFSYFWLIWQLNFNFIKKMKSILSVNWTMNFFFQQFFCPIFSFLIKVYWIRVNKVNVQNLQSFLGLTYDLFILRKNASNQGNFFSNFLQWRSFIILFYFC